MVLGPVRIGHNVTFGHVRRVSLLRDVCAESVSRRRACPTSRQSATTHSSITAYELCGDACALRVITYACAQAYVGRGQRVPAGVKWAGVPGAPAGPSPARVRARVCCVYVCARGGCG
jgi:hypothetical protein